MADEEIITVRIPELPARVDELSGDDLLAFWSAGTDKTRRLLLNDLATFISTGGSGSTVQPSINGTSFIHFVTAAEAGGNTVSIPTLAGQQFTLNRDGQWLEMGSDDAPKEYSILAGGGFKITIPDDELIKGQRFFGQVFTLQGGVPVTPGAGGSFITGKYQVVTNLPMTVADHIGKLMQVRAGATPLSITLPDLEDIPANTIIPFEADITNTYQSTIKTQGGQSIYLNNVSANEIYIGPGENLWLFRGDDGFYLLTNYPDVGKILASYTAGIHELLCDGSLVDRAKYPRLWAHVQTLGPSLVSDALWSTASITLAGRTVSKPYRGCFSSGDGSTTFRLPDLMNSAIRGLKNNGGSDTERYYNHAGGFQRNEYEEHFHTGIEGDTASHASSSTALSGTIKWLVNTSDEGHGTVQDSKTGSSGGSETRMDNVGLFWVVKI